MKIYFAGSIRGGRDDKNLYFELIKHISKYGDVLTEHIGDKALSSKGENKTSDNFIYQRDINWIKQSDAIIAEITNPSLGVGYELAKTEIINKKNLCLFRKQKKYNLSAMISGNKNFNVKYYQTTKQAKKYIDDFLKNI